jgi:hypothetical protein
MSFLLIPLFTSEVFYAIAIALFIATVALILRLLVKMMLSSKKAMKSNYSSDVEFLSKPYKYTLPSNDITGAEEVQEQPIDSKLQEMEERLVRLIVSKRKR